MSEEKKKIHHMFVYGTLKEGRPLDRPMFAKTRLAVKPATIIGYIYNTGWFPGVKLDGKHEVIGEVHEFRSKDMKTIIPTMDSIEGYNPDRPEGNNLFNRRVVVAKTKDGKEVEAYVYEFNKDISEKHRVKSGCWEPSED